VIFVLTDVTMSGSVILGHQWWSRMYYFGQPGGVWQAWVDAFSSCHWIWHCR